MAEEAARKRLVWDIKKDLITYLPADELFHIVKVIGPTPGKDISELDLEDSEGCFECTDALMSSKSFLEAEDQDMSELLSLQQTVTSIKQACTVVYSHDVKDIHPTSRTHSHTTTDPVQSTSLFNVMTWVMLAGPELTQRQKHIGLLD